MSENLAAGARIVKSAGLSGLSGFEVLVETSIANGLPVFLIVGLPDSAVREARDRVRAVVRNLGFDFPMKRILVNLAPADTRKEGPLYDLPIALGLLVASGQLGAVPDDTIFAGELSLDGGLRPVAGVLPMALSVRDAGARHMFVPADNASEAALADGLNVYPARHISEIIEHLRGGAGIAPAGVYAAPADLERYPDFADVRGQETTRRAIEVAVSGAHNILLSGTAGGGKSMMAKRVPSILPPMDRDEMIESTAIHSIAGMTERGSPLLLRRPFRSPHHTVSSSGMAGGGRLPKPGEMSLAHNGVLFLDEFPEFHRDVLECMRQPMEDGQVTITRANGSFTYPSRFMLVCAMNPCKCGWHGHHSGRCACSEESVRRYLGRISGPILDRIDIFAAVPPVEYDELSGGRAGEPSADIRRRVAAARKRQAARQGAPNAQLTNAQLREFCPIGGDGEKLMKAAYEKLDLSARAYSRILKVARSIADLSSSDRIECEHLAEAIQYRNMCVKEL
ncbi:MAG: YifB family Mg chelatase-like AAA ATPase [Clostridiales Family XIII bacterium]|nr:YifB family Mg chelatase-like AAA ATPase [Clostridiales Family XIII bacterium]